MIKSKNKPKKEKKKDTLWEHKKALSKTLKKFSFLRESK